MIDFPDSFLRTFKLKMFIFSILIIFNLLPFQEVGRVIGIALMKQFGWKADLRNPNLEVMNVHFILYAHNLIL